jgi:flagellar hook assembly protein FlgD
MDKHGFLFFILVSFTGIIPTVGAQWSNPVEISWGSVPDMDLHPATGAVHVTTVTGGRIVYSKLDQNGTMVTQENVPGVTQEQGDGYFGPSIAVDSEGFPHIAYRIESQKMKFDLFYLYKTAAGWVPPITIAEDVNRGYSCRLDVDAQNRVHLVYGSAGTDVWGPVTYVRIEQGSIVARQTGMTKYRADDRVEIDARGETEVNLVIGCPDPNGGPVTYWRSADGSENLSRVDDIHDPDCRDRNGSPDLFVDTIGSVHFCYGSNKDFSLDNTPSVRYARFRNGIKIHDSAVTPQGFLTEWHQGLGIASVAASDQGENIVIAFAKTDGGLLYEVHSSDLGDSWSEPVQLTSTGYDGFEARNKPVIRANQQRFFVAYPSDDGKVYLRWREFDDQQNPVAAAGGPYSGREGATILFDASGSTDNQGLVTYEWDWEADGIFDTNASVPTATHRFEDNFTGYVVLRVSDRSGNSARDSADVTILNTNPVVEAGSNINANEGDVLTFAASVTDSGSLDTHQFMWFWGDGDSTAGQRAAHSFRDNATFQVTCRATDKDGGHGSDLLTATIKNLPPVADAGGPYSGATNQILIFAGKATDAGVADTSALIFRWDLNNDGQFETNGQIVTKSFASSGNYKIKIQVTDKDGGVGDADAMVEIKNQPPQVRPIPNQSIDEGGTFANIVLDDYVSDPDNLPSEITWRAEGAVDLHLIFANRVASVKTPSVEWNGAETIQLIATDPGGTSDTAAVVFTVFPINDPPVVQLLLNQTISETDFFEMINLDALVRDPDHTPAEMTWSCFGQENFRVQIQQNQNAAPVWSATIAPADSEWSGSEVLTFVVVDPGHLADSTAATFSITAVNDAPQIREIPEQVINSGWTFPALILDDLVFDPDHPDTDLVWRFSGNSRLKVEIVDRVATVTVPSLVWEGSEEIVFSATDLLGASGQRAVRFTVILSNKPPYLAPAGNISFNEDTYFQISRNDLENLVTDADDPPQNFIFSLLDSPHLEWGIHPVNGGLLISAQENWNGLEIATLVVHDGRGGLDSTDFKVTVVPVPDPPASFHLLDPINIEWQKTPEWIQFSWQQAHDPDGDGVHYLWFISSNFNFTDTLALNLAPDTTFQFFITEPQKFVGDMYWKVLAYSLNDNFFTPCSNLGHIKIHEPSAVTESKLVAIPDEFRLLPNFPNPFNPETRISYHLPQTTSVRLEVFNSRGELVRVLENSAKAAGIHTVFWNGQNASAQAVASGLYFYRLQAGAQQLVQKMLLMK